MTDTNLKSGTTQDSKANAEAKQKPTALTPAISQRTMDNLSAANNLFKMHLKHSGAVGVIMGCILRQAKLELSPKGKRGKKNTKLFAEEVNRVIGLKVRAAENRIHLFENLLKKTEHKRVYDHIYKHVIEDVMEIDNVFVEAVATGLQKAFGTGADSLTSLYKAVEMDSDEEREDKPKLTPAQKAEQERTRNDAVDNQLKKAGKVIREALAEHRKDTDAKELQQVIAFLNKILALRLEPIEILEEEEIDGALTNNMTVSV